MDLADLDLKPKDVDEADWEAFPPGVRLRVVRDHQYGLELTPEQYEALARVPYWLLYGPEHGAPVSWFNPEGYLLPKYRPGGSRFPELLARRRRYRGRRLLLHRARERRVRRAERDKRVAGFAMLAGGLGVFLLVSWVSEVWFGEGAPAGVELLELAVAVGVYGAGAAAFGVLRVLVERWVVGARWARRVGSE